MVNILEDNSFMAQLGREMRRGVEKGGEIARNRQDEQTRFDQQMQLQEMKQKKDENINKAHAFESLKDTISRLKYMVDEDVSGIGFFGEYDPRPEAQQNRGEFQTLTSDLFTFYKTLFPRGITQEEFKRLEKDYIPKAGEATSKMKGKLKAFTELIEKKLEESVSVKDEKKLEKKGKVKFNIANPEHKAKRDQVLKDLQGDREKAKKILEREFEI